MSAPDPEITVECPLQQSPQKKSEGNGAGATYEPNDKTACPQGRIDYEACFAPFRYCPVEGCGHAQGTSPGERARRLKETILAAKREFDALPPEEQAALRASAQRADDAAAFLVGLPLVSPAAKSTGSRSAHPPATASGPAITRSGTSEASGGPSMSERATGEPVTTTPAQTLREAASRMRELAQAATPGPWIVGGDDDDERLLIEVGEPGKFRPIALMPSDRDDPETWQDDSADAAHIAAWHPAVALAVANWLDEVVALIEFGSELNRAGEVGAALNVARVFLGTDR